MATGKQVCRKCSACLLIASTTAGAVEPTLRTPMPPAKSRKTLPSTSVMVAPPADSMNTGTPMDTPRETAAWRRCSSSRERGPGTSVRRFTVLCFTGEFSLTGVGTVHHWRRGHRQTRLLHDDHAPRSGLGKRAHAPLPEVEAPRRLGPGH